MMITVRVTALLLLCTLCSIGTSAEKMLFDFEPGFNVSSVACSDASVAIIQRDGDAALRLSMGHSQDWPGITFKAPDGRWDLSAFEYVAVDVTNVGTDRCDVHLRVDSPTDDGEQVSITGNILLAPGDTKTLTVALTRRLPKELTPRIFGMRGYPGGFAKENAIDPANIDQLLIFAHQPSKDHTLEIDSIRAGGSSHTPNWLTMSDDEFFPMIDRFGQFVHKSWIGKVESIDDFRRLNQEEAIDLDQHPRPDTWNQYGGWKEGPQLQATGRFRVEKHRGKWWLVDPDGQLFWSHGIDCVRSTTGYTPITGREFLFADLPARESPFGQFYGQANWAPHGFYQGKSFATYNFSGANLLIKYGPNWREQFADLCHRRLRSWGMNTIGNWSDSSIYLMRKTPYVATLDAGKKPIEGSSGYWGKFPDVFDPEFRESLVKRLAAEKGKTSDDPWCIGYFVDNELAWGDEISLAIATLASPPDQVAKQVFLIDLKAKYDTIAKLNASWGTEHSSWDELMKTTIPPDPRKARDDLLAFYSKTAEQYFRTCAEAIEYVAPQTLYLGCRFAWVNDRAVRAAAKHCDVLSFNRYQPSVAEFRLPDGVDKPTIIGEFHFGALDRGMFHTGLQAARDQSARAAAYTGYLQGALKNPWLVGTHWFQYGDQATTGRGDGENYQIGFLDICDTPYSEIIKSSRSVGVTMYRLRLDAVINGIQ